MFSSRLHAGKPSYEDEMPFVFCCISLHPIRFKKQTKNKNTPRSQLSLAHMVEVMMVQHFVLFRYVKVYTEHCF